MASKTGAFFILMLLAVPLTAAADEGFHSGGVAQCEGCHSMHNSLNAQPMNGKTSANPYLLMGADPSSTCLNCHHTTSITPNAYKVSSPANAITSGGRPAPSQLGPAGDFGWSARHNIVATDYSYTQDPLLSTAPGGTYPREKLSCISCHDPHGRYRHLAGSSEQFRTGAPIRESGSYGAEPDGATAVGVYRLLGGTGYQPVSVTGGYSFVSKAPVAVAPLEYNRSEAESDTRVAYGAGMSEWCSNCHSSMHNDDAVAPGSFRHPAGNNAKLGATLIANYKRYDFRTGSVNADGATAYSSLVPYEMGTEVRSDLLAATLSTAGPSSGLENVSCLSCHRAHASGFPTLGRWNFGTDMVYDGFPPPQAFYGRTQAYFATAQRSLCNKCHVRD